MTTNRTPDCLKFLSRGALILALSAALAPARDAYVLISGGGTPLTNNYSQLLQAQGITKSFQERYPKDSVWIFFGMGNLPGQPSRIADVRKQVKEEGGLLRESWLPGVLPENRPARKTEILRALREEILPAVQEGDTLYLFVGDHGSLARKDPKESVVTLWQLENPGDGDNGWRTNVDETLSVTELREVLAEGLGKGRVVFCMTQCHSGGFHYLGVPRAVMPPAAWFSEVPEWVKPDESPDLPLAAGFTAVDEESLAAGCDPDPDPDRWAGYERYIPEALFGLELFSGTKTGAGLGSFAAAHEASVLIDQTIDKPRSSSEQYLERWATVIEKLADEVGLLPEVKANVVAYREAVDEGLATADDPLFSAKRITFERYLERMVVQNPGAGELLTKGTREALTKSFGPRPPAGGPDGGGGGRGGANRPNRRTKVWTDTLRPAWKSAVEEGMPRVLTGEALEFEKFLLEQEEKGRDFMFPRGWQNPMLNDLFWRSGYSFPQKMDLAKAEEITRWGARRKGAILDWAKESHDPDLRAAGERLAPPARPDGQSPPPRTLARTIAAERTVFYRRTLAAWAFLLAMKEEAALDRLHRLIELETTPLPAGQSVGQ